MSDNDYMNLQVAVHRLKNSAVELRENHIINAWEQISKSIDILDAILEHEKRPTMCEQGRKTDE